MKKEALRAEYGSILSQLTQEARVLDGIHDVSAAWAMYGFMLVFCGDAQPEACVWE